MNQTTNSPYLVKLTPNNSVLVMVDYLTGFLPAIKTIDAETFQNNVTALAKVGSIFQLPTIILGDEGGFRGEFMPQIDKHLSHGKRVERHTPSVYGAPEFVGALEKIDRPKVIMAGISTDNCVTQTGLDLLKAGYEVYIIVDASGTDSKLVEDAAIARMMQAGAVITNWGCIASELMGDWQSPEGEKIGAVYQEHSQWGGQ